MKSTVFKYILAVLLILGAVSVNDAAAKGHNFEINPVFGYAQPLADQGENWLPGFEIGLESAFYHTHGFDLGARLGFQHWFVNAEEKLAMQDSEALRIEREKGRRYSVNLSATGRYKFGCWETENFWMALDGSLGAYYLHTEAVKLKGFFNQAYYDEEADVWNYVAINHEIYEEPNVEFVPGVSLGLSMMLNRRVQPSVQFQHIFSSDDGGMSLFKVSLGLLAN